MECGAAPAGGVYPSAAGKADRQGRGPRTANCVALQEKLGIHNSR